MFSCNQCGGLGACWHKANVSRTIRFLPNQQRTRQELNSLSTAERGQVWADMFGTSFERNGDTGSKYEVYEANPDDETIEASLEMLRTELSLLADNTLPENRAAYEQALELSPDYVTNKQFQLSFLYADKFNVKAACKRLIGHFQVKRELFGESKLGRDITLDDLSPKELEIYRKGEFVRFLPTMDSANRPIVFARAAKADFQNPARMVSPQTESSAGARGAVFKSFWTYRRATNLQFGFPRSLSTRTRLLTTALYSLVTYLNICFSSQ